MEDNPELVLLDAGSWTAVDPGPLKSLAEVSGYRDLLNKHEEVKAAITRLLAQSKAKVSSLMAFGVEALLDQGEVGVSLWRSLIRQRVVVTAPTRDNFVLLPRVSAIQKTEDWRIEILKRRQRSSLYSQRWVVNQTSAEVKAKLEKSLGRVTQTCKFQEETVKCNKA